MPVRKGDTNILVFKPEVKVKAVIHSIDKGGIPLDNLGSSLGVIHSAVTTICPHTPCPRCLAEHLGQFIYMHAGSALTSYL
jgi:hypothetical protein